MQNNTIDTSRRNKNHSITGAVGSARKRNQLVDFSVRAQDFILKQGIHSYRNSMVDGPTGIGNFANASNPDINNFLDDSTGLPQTDNAGASENDRIGQFQLPSINTKNASPFKGFLDVSIVSKKLRKNV